jgi:hypothetical protein
MEKKATSGPMTEMLNRLTAFCAGGYPEFCTVIFSEDTCVAFSHGRARAACPYGSALNACDPHHQHPISQAAQQAR